MSLRDLIIWFGFCSMDYIRESATMLAGYQAAGENSLDGILNKENRNIIANNVPISLLRIKFDGESSDIPDSIGGALGAQNGREP